METKRFRFYTSKISAYDILKGIFLYADRGQDLFVQPAQVQRLFS